MAMPGFMEDGFTMAKNAFSKNLHSNNAINKIDKNNPAGFLGGISGAIINNRKGDDIWTSVKNAHTNKDGNANYAAIAGSFMVAGAGYRALSGGGVYRDSNGNTDIAGIPFI